MRPRLGAVHVRCAGATDPGPHREHNEDAFFFEEAGGAAIAVVADGMGGMSSGRAAADLVIDTCARAFRERDRPPLDEIAEAWWIGEHGSGALAYASLPDSARGELCERAASVLATGTVETQGDLAVLEAERRLVLEVPLRALRLANRVVYERSESDPRWRGFGAAVVGVLFADGQASIAHVGDSRVYLVRGPGEDPAIEALTTDHSLVNEYRRLQLDITEEEIADLPRNVITRAIGMKDTVEIDTRIISIQPGDAFVLCSDGLWSVFTDEEIARAVRGRGAAAAGDLVARGAQPSPAPSRDNLTAVVVEIL